MRGAERPRLVEPVEADGEVLGRDAGNELAQLLEVLRRLLGEFEPVEGVAVPADVDVAGQIVDLALVASDDDADWVGHDVVPRRGRVPLLDRAVEHATDGDARQAGVDRGEGGERLHRAERDRLVGDLRPQLGRQVEDAQPLANEPLAHAGDAVRDLARR